MVTAEQMEAARREYVAALGTAQEFEKRLAFVRLIVQAKKAGR